MVIQGGKMNSILAAVVVSTVLLPNDDTTTGKNFDTNKPAKHFFSLIT